MSNLNTTLDYTSLRFFSKLIKDYLNKEEATTVLYHHYPSLAAFEAQLKERKNFAIDRNLLVENLQQQYKKLTNTEYALTQINALSEANTYTVTTGHQLNLFTGPLYFMYKIASTIQLAKQLKDAYPTYNFVPVYWMATEDHDFDEINHFNYKDTQFSWEDKAAGAVGELGLKNLTAVFEQLTLKLGGSTHAVLLQSLFREAYLNHKDLASATQFLVHQLFGETGLVIIDANAVSLKRSFIPHMLQDIKAHLCKQEVGKTNSYLKEQGYKVQVNPRVINLFYLSKNLRERIVKKGEDYIVNTTDKKFTLLELEQEIQAHPERFSPNVLLRPLYQESILPNLAYIGGGGEIAYWLQLKTFFKKSQVSYPILMLRNSVLWLSRRQAQKLAKFGLKVADLFLTPDALTKKYLQLSSSPKLDFSPFEKQLRDLYEQIETVASCTDVTFSAAAKAQEQQQVKALYHLEKRLLRAQKKKQSEDIKRLLALQQELFPDGGLQERTQNFSSIYMNLGEVFFKQLREKLNPFDTKFTVLTNSL